MELTTQEIGDVTVVLPAGPHLDAGNYRDFKDALLPIVRDNAKVILDLQNIQFMDSSGIGAILSSLRGSQECNNELRLCNTAKPVQVIFQLVRLEQIAAIDETREASLAALSGA